VDGERETQKNAANTPRSRLQRLRYFEDLVIAAALLMMVLVPIANAIARKVFTSGIPGASVVTQALVLIVSMLGGAIAAREGRLLSLSTIRTLVSARWKSAVLVFSNGFAIVVSAFLSVAGFKYVWQVRPLERTLVYGIPEWCLQLFLPLGFAAITVRLLLSSAEKTRGKAIAALLAIVFALVAAFPPVAPENLVTPAIIMLLIAAALGAPIFTVLGGAALILFWGQYSPISSITLDHYQMVVNPSLAAIPLFTLAGYFLAEGGASRRLIAVFKALVGGLRGGPAILTALVCAFFTSFTGASGVTILALGALLLPVLLAAKYTERNTIGLLTGAGSLGLLFPPALPLILYSIVASQTLGAGVTIEEIFLGGVIPGVVLVALTATWGIMQAPRLEQRERFNATEAAKAAWEAKWELLLPVVALVSLFGGFATPVEAAAITAFYALVVETLIYRDLRLVRDVPRVTAECGLIVGGVLLIVGVAIGFTNYLIYAQIPDYAVEWVQTNIQSKWVFLLALNAFLLIVGALMDIYSAIVVVVPLIVPVGIAMGVDPVHLGIIFLANMELGYLTPPVGMNLFLSAYRFDKPVPWVMRSAVPMFFVLLIGVLLITYVPALTTVLPGLAR
jgi:tripartite ATP-independent transporter DctM subunit